MRYRKKPVEIEAIQWTGDNIGDIIEFCNDKANVDVQRITSTRATAKIVIHTPEGDMNASIGDFIIRGIKGEYYPCKPDIFHETYDPIAQCLME